MVGGEGPSTLPCGTPTHLVVCEVIENEVPVLIVVASVRLVLHLDVVRVQLLLGQRHQKRVVVRPPGNFVCMIYFRCIIELGGGVMKCRV